MKMGFRFRIRLFHILHFVRDLLFPLLKNSKSGVDDRGHRFRSGSPLTNYPYAAPAKLLHLPFCLIIWCIYQNEAAVRELILTQF